MYAFSGTYKVEGTTTVSTISGSWNELWTRQTQTRQSNYRGKTLTITSAVKTPDGKDSVITTRLVRVEQQA